MPLTNELRPVAVSTAPGMARRHFLQILGGSAFLYPSSVLGDESAQDRQDLWAGETTIDITPPLGVELAGYHRAPGQERRAGFIRQPTEGRILVLRSGGVTLAVISLELCAVSKEFTQRIRTACLMRYEIPPSNLHVCATHTHSMPTFRPFRQWGGIPTQYMAEVEHRVVEGVGKALEDLRPAMLRVGKAQASGASFNRTSAKYRTDLEFGPEATPDDRWLDTLLQALIIQRQGSEFPLLWYHFSAHPVCYADDGAGPDWPGLVADEIRKKLGVRPAFLQGHAGDVNPGGGQPWRGDPHQVTDAIVRALEEAVAKANPVQGTPLRSAVTCCLLPLNLELYQGWLDEFSKNPEGCSKGHWVNQYFAKAWYEDQVKQPWKDPELKVELGLARVGQLTFIFHPAELYSYYGISIRTNSPTPHTLVVGYANDIIGYLPDLQAFVAGEYGAITVPKILDLPPFRPEAAQMLAFRAIELANL